MKELSIEEKAKAYDEAKARMSIAYNSNRCTIGFMNEIFPETTESEDERIRKELITIIECAADDNSHIYISKIDSKRYIAWLEKHGEQKLTEEYNITGIGSKNAQGTLGEMIKNLKPVNEVLEQQPTDKVEPKFKIGDYVKNVNDKREPIYEIVYMDKECYICEYRGKERMGDKAVMHFAFDNPYLRLVEPKFKIEKDKWYVCISQYCNCIEGRNYKASADGRIIDDYGTEYDMHDDAYKWFRLWTIQDAKDGDVLYCKSSGIEYIVMSKGVNEYDNIDSYFRYNSHAGFGIDVPSVFSSWQDDITPATKEQHDFLFRKMHDAGYEWDAENKQLKKIEQNPTDEEMKELLHTEYEKGRADAIAEMQNAWSEEDERIYQSIIDDTVQENQLDSKQIDWLKSLKDRYTWKPSDAQIASLTIACDRNDRIGFDLTQLLRDLKKLKG